MLPDDESLRASEPNEIRQFEAQLRALRPRLTVAPEEVFYRAGWEAALVDQSNAATKSTRSTFSFAGGLLAGIAASMLALFSFRVFDQPEQNQPQPNHMTADVAPKEVDSNADSLQVDPNSSSDTLAFSTDRSQVLRNRLLSFSHWLSAKSNEQATVRDQEVYERPIQLTVSTRSLQQLDSLPRTWLAAEPPRPDIDEPRDVIRLRPLHNQLESELF